LNKVNRCAVQGKGKLLKEELQAGYLRQIRKLERNPKENVGLMN